MKKGLIVLGVVVVVFWGLYSWVKGFNNTMVTLKEEVTGQWANVETSYQRRSDLIPNLVNTAKGYANFEKETLTQVIRARASATAINITPDNLSSASIAKFQQAQAGLSGALSKLLVSMERYPDLKANENFKQIMNQLERTENRINVERNRFNNNVKSYNTYIKKFPNSTFAGWFSFEPMTYFKAEAGTEKAPKVEF